MDDKSLCQNHRYREENVEFPGVPKFGFFLISGDLQASPASFSDVSARSCVKANITTGGCQAPAVLLLLAAH